MASREVVDGSIGETESPRRKGDPKLLPRDRGNSSVIETAIHEAGHAVVCERLPRTALKVDVVTIVPGENYLGRCLFRDYPQEWDDWCRRDDWILSCAGYAAEIIYGVSESAAEEAAGDDFADVPETELPQLKRAAIDLLRRNENWSAVIALAKQLLCELTVSGNRVRELIR